MERKIIYHENSEEYMRGYLNGMIMADGSLSFNKSNNSIPYCKIISI